MIRMEVRPNPRAPHVIRRALAAGARRHAREVEAAARRAAPVRTGALRASHRLRQVGPLRWIVEATIRYAPFVHARNPWLTRAGAQVRRRSLAGVVRLIRQRLRG